MRIPVSPHPRPSAGRSTTSGFAIVVTLIFLTILLLLIAVLGSVLQLNQRGDATEADLLAAQQAALAGLHLAVGELQEVAGPDQRVTATASLLTDSTTIALDPNRAAWTGVWDTSGYQPDDPGNKNLLTWLVSAKNSVGEYELPTDVEDIESTTLAFSDPVTLVTAPDGSPYLEADKVLLDDLKKHRYFAFGVEDESVKADLSWNEMDSTQSDPERVQSARLSSVPGPDYEVFDGLGSPFLAINSPLSTSDLSAGTGNMFLVDGIEPMRDPADLQTLMTADAAWLREQRPHLTWGSRGVLADNKNGGLRQDLSLAFEMDGEAESENATRFNQQVGEFVAGGAPLSAPQLAPGMTIADRFLYRDLPGAGQTFSGDIAQPLTVVRGPSWWLMRDYATLYKRLSTAGSHYAMDARAYYPNRTTIGNRRHNLIDIHKDDQWDSVPEVASINQEVNQSTYAFRPVRASYAPVLLGVNAIYSLIYEGGRLKMIVDPFFIIWNPYDTQIEADQFAVTLQNGLAGGVRFRVTDSAGKEKLYGQPSWWGGGRGSDTAFFHFARHKSGTNANLSYLISDLVMEPGEVLIYSAPSEADRSSDATVLNDELLPGMRYNATDSGIFFDQFPDDRNRNWGSVTGSSNDKIDVLFNIASQTGYAIVNIIETNLPAAGLAPDDFLKPDDLTTEINFGDHLAGREYRLNWGGGQKVPNVDTGARGFNLSYTFGELTSKRSFGMLSMLVMPTDHPEADSAYEVFSQLNVTAATSTNREVFLKAPLNMVVKSVPADGINNLMNEIGVDIDAFGSGENGFYGKSYALSEGDTAFPLLSIPESPPHSLIELSGANIGTRLLEPTHAIGNSWRPPYIPGSSVYYTSAAYYRGVFAMTIHDSSWLVNDALFDGYFLSGLAPEYSIETTGYTLGSGASLGDTLLKFYGSDSKTAEANQVLEPYVPRDTSTSEVVAELDPDSSNYATSTYDGYKRLGAYSFVRGSFNVNSTSVPAWTAMLKGNRDIAIEDLQGGTDTGTGSPFPLSPSTSNVSSNNGWELLSRLSDTQVDDLAVEIVEQVKARGPFMSLSDFVNRRIGVDALSDMGAVQQAIEDSGINASIRSSTSSITPNYGAQSGYFPFADVSYAGDRNNATGIPQEINQANVLLPLAPRLTARSDTFRIRAYGEVRASDDTKVLAKAMCEAVVQRLPEYVDDDDKPWTEPVNLSAMNQQFGRRFKIIQLRWLAPDEI